MSIPFTSNWVGDRQDPGGMGGVDKLTRNRPIGDLGLNKDYLLLDFFFL